MSVIAPARVDLSAGFPDVAPFCTAMPGFVLNASLNLEVTVVAGGRDERLTGFAGDLVSYVARRLDVPVPSLAHHAPGLPPGSGLGSSGALSVALTYATAVDAGRPLEIGDVVELACEAERATCITGGTQDQLASAYGGVGLVERHHGTGTRTPVPVNLAAVADRLTLVHPGGARNSGSIIDAVLRDGSQKSSLAVIRRMSAVARETADVVEDDVEALVACVAESAELLGRLHPAIVDPSIGDVLRSSGAAAAKPCGAGGPGAVWLAVTEPAARADFRAAVTARGLRVLAAEPSPSGVRLAA